MAKHTIALVGVGSIAIGQYIPQIVQMPDAELVALCDILPGRAESYAARFNIPRSYTSFEAMLEHEDFSILVNTTSIQHGHFPLNKAALERGKHVYSQKPFATSVEEATILIETARANNVWLAASPLHMLRPDLQEMKRLIEAGAIGKVHFASVRSSHGGPEYWQYREVDPSWFYHKGAGPLYDLGVHGLHAITGLLGPAKAVSCMSGISDPQRTVYSGTHDGKIIEPEVDDLTLLMLDFGGGTYATLDCTYCVKAGRRPGMEIYGSRGTITTSYDEKQPFEIFRDEPALRLRGWTQPTLRLEKVQQSVGVLDLMRAVDENRPPVLTPEHARHVIEIMNTCMEAARTGCTQQLSTTF